MLNLTAFEDRGIELPALLPTSINPQGLLFSNETPLPDPMDLVSRGAMVVHSNSAGKDSQAQLIHLVERLGVPPEQIVSIHADLGRSEWEGTEEHARSIAEAYGIRFFVTRALNKAGEIKELVDYMDQRGQWPARGQRWCTSDFKRGPIRREINRIRKMLGHSSPYVLNCMGMRAAESVERAKLDPFEYAKDASCPSVAWPEVLEAKTTASPRYYFDWHPILHYSEEQVFATIEAAGQKPHWAYAAGARRLSCLVCIFSSEEDVRVAATYSQKGRDYIREIIRLEDKHNHTILPMRSATRDRPAQKRFIRDIVSDLIAV